MGLFNNFRVIQNNTNIKRIMVITADDQMINFEHPFVHANIKDKSILIWETMSAKPNRYTFAEDNVAKMFIEANEIWRLVTPSNIERVTKTEMEKMIKK